MSHNFETNDNEGVYMYKITFQRKYLFTFKYYISLTNKYKYMKEFSFLLENLQGMTLLNHLTIYIFMLRQEASIPSHGGLSVCLSSKYFDFLNKDDWAGIRFEKSTKRSIW